MGPAIRYSDSRHRSAFRLGAYIKRQPRGGTLPAIGKYQRGLQMNGSSAVIANTNLQSALLSGSGQSLVRIDSDPRRIDTEVGVRIRNQLSEKAVLFQGPLLEAQGLLTINRKRLSMARRNQLRIEVQNVLNRLQIVPHLHLVAVDQVVPQGLGFRIVKEGVPSESHPYVVNRGK